MQKWADNSEHLVAHPPNRPRFEEKDHISHKVYNLPRLIEGYMLLIIYLITFMTTNLPVMRRLSLPSQTNHTTDMDLLRPSRTLFVAFAVYSRMTTVQSVKVLESATKTTVQMQEHEEVTMTMATTVSDTVLPIRFW